MIMMTLDMCSFAPFKNRQSQSDTVLERDGVSYWERTRCTKLLKQSVNENLSFEAESAFLVRDSDLPSTCSLFRSTPFRPPWSIVPIFDKKSRLSRARQRPILSISWAHSRIWHLCIRDFYFGCASDDRAVPSCMYLSPLIPHETTLESSVIPYYRAATASLKWFDIRTRMTTWDL